MIKFQCPSCGATLKVADGLAGRKAPCPSCKQTLTIPAASNVPAANGAKAPESAKAAPAARPAVKAAARTVPTAAGKVPPPAPIKAPPQSNAAAPPAPPAAPPPEQIDTEALAAEAFADEPKPAETTEHKTITFNCPQCDDPVTVSMEFAGKQTPCPSCRRIVKVPLPQKTEPRDWRQPNKNIPSGAKENLAPEAPVGATSTGTVSREALQEAGAIPEQREKLTRAQLLKRIGIAAAVLLAVGLGVWKTLAFLSEDKQFKAVREADKLITDARNPRPEAVAALHRAMGEWYLRCKRRDALQKAQEKFTTAKGKIRLMTTVDHEVVLLDLALTEVHLGGTREEIEAGRRLPWERPPGPNALDPTVQKALQGTLADITFPEAKVLATREVARRVFKQGERNQAKLLFVAVLSGDNLRQEAYGLAGLEFLNADPAEGENLARQGLQAYNPAVVGKGKRPDVAPSLVALCVALKKPELLRVLPEAKDGTESLDMQVRKGFAVGLALQGDRRGLDAAKGVLGPDKIQALLEAAMALPADQARPYMEAALELAEGEFRSNTSSWTKARLVYQSIRCGLPERAAKVAGTIPDASLRGWAQLQVLRASLAATGAKVEDSRANEVEKQTVSWFLAWEAIARHNAKYDAGTRKAVGTWDDAVRPFGLVGYALGLQDNE